MDISSRQKIKKETLILKTFDQTEYIYIYIERERERERTFYEKARIIHFFQMYMEHSPGLTTY